MKPLVKNFSVCLIFTLNTVFFLPKVNAAPTCRVNLSGEPGGYLNIRRSGPSGEIIGSLNEGTEVFIMSIFDDWNRSFTNSWYKVRVNNSYQPLVGWVESSYINCYNAQASSERLQSAKPCRRYSNIDLYDRPNGQRISYLIAQTLVYPISYVEGWTKLAGYNSQGIYQEFGWANEYELRDCQY